jgi:peroxiredoxin
MPRLSLLDLQGNATELPDVASYRLLTVWATWCEPCIHELRELDENSTQLTDAGIQWYAVNVDDVASAAPTVRAAKAATFIDKLDIAVQGFLATQSAIECLDVVQRSLVTKQSPLPVPSSFLIDPSGQLMAVYKGNVRAEQIAGRCTSFRPTSWPSRRG